MDATADHLGAMLILDPALGGKLRLVLKILTLAATILAAVEGSFPALAWVASVGAAVNAAVAALTHLTALGNAEQ